MFYFVILLFVIIGCNTHMDTTMNKKLDNYDKATFAGGCFWCSENDFQKQDGVIEVVSGYTGGNLENPTYEEVSTGQTGHREAIQVYYDSSKISYEELLEIFWKHIDPTDSAGQFVDRGFQYTSAIYYHNEKQKNLAENSKKKVQEFFEEPIVTQILPAEEFYKAEEYHQDFFKKNKLQYKYYRYRSGRDEFIENNWKGVSLYNDSLTPLQYYVTQENGTEEPFNNKYWDNTKEGIYVDIISKEPLFSSKDKFKSGTGWPSFTKPIKEDAIIEKKDNSIFMNRVEVRSASSDSHLGHVFEDGPEPTVLRYCMNSAALIFIPKEKLKEKGYRKYLDEFK